MNILELPQRDFMAMLPELKQQGVDTDALLRQYRSANSPLAGVNQAAEAARSGITDEGRRGVAGGLLSKDVGTTGMDALRSLRVEPMAGLLGALSGAGQAVEAPSAAARGLIPTQDMGLEALGTAGMAMAGGGAMTRPRGSVGMGGRVAGGRLNVRDLLRSEDGDAVASSAFSQAGSPRPVLSDAPVKVSRLPDGRVYLVDGYHRAENALRNGDGSVDVEYVDFEKIRPLFENERSFVSANRDQTTGLLSTAAAAEPRNAAERMAREILDMRAAGRARDVTDDMMAQADPQYMYNNTPLPMDEASRLARAGDAGFDTGVPLYHGTGADFQAFMPSERGKVGPGVYLTPEVDLAEVFSSENGRIIPSYATNNPAPMDVRTRAGNARRVAGMGEAGADAFRRELSGYDGVSVHDQRTILDPRNIRSRFARFDPEFSHLSNLSAANASPTAGLLGVSAVQEDKKELPFMNFMRGLLQ